MSLLEEATERVEDLTAKVEYVVAWLDARGMLEDGTFTFPDGETWWASRAHPQPSVWGEVEDGFGTVADRCGPACDLHVVRPGKLQCEGTDARCPVPQHPDLSGLHAHPAGHVPDVSGRDV